MVDLVPIDYNPHTTMPVENNPFEPIPLSQTAGRVDAPWRPDQVAPPPQHLTSMANNPIAHGIGEAILSPITEAGEYVGGLMQGTIPFEPGEAVKEGLKLGSAFIGPKTGAGTLAGILSGAKIAERVAPKIAAKATSLPILELGSPEAPGVIQKTLGSSIARDIEREGGWALDRHVPPPEALRTGYDQPSYHGSGHTFDGPEIKFPRHSENVQGTAELYSTPDPELAGLYAGSTALAQRRPQIAPLLLKTKDYHTFDAGGRKWNQVQSEAIREAQAKNAPGVKIHNVWDEPDLQHNLSEPKTVFVTLDPSTARSRFAKFDPANMHLNDLMASGAAISLPASVIASKTLVPVEHNPFAAEQ